ncbi:MAG: hypothetical protein KDI34_22685, partial [Halioglobus sp.]|nr:hypothetical protein [Halioglobus sp.]
TGSDWELVASKNLDSTKGITRVVDITGTQKARYFVLIAGDRNGEYNDAFRLAGLRVTCDPNNCKPPASNDGVTPIPGTLALLGIGALATRRRFLKQS